jgi:hypothetical protein
MFRSDSCKLLSTHVLDWYGDGLEKKVINNISRKTGRSEPQGMWNVLKLVCGGFRSRVHVHGSVNSRKSSIRSKHGLPPNGISSETPWAWRRACTKRPYIRWCVNDCPAMFREISTPTFAQVNYGNKAVFGCLHTISRTGEGISFLHVCTSSWYKKQTFHKCPYRKIGVDDEDMKSNAISCKLRAIRIEFWCELCMACRLRDRYVCACGWEYLLQVI